jgi:hypothetical protein
MEAVGPNRADAQVQIDLRRGLQPHRENDVDVIR